MTLASIFGCSGPTLSPEEAAFFRSVQPWGFIVFRRNVESPVQLQALTAALRATVERADAPVLIDQEGGRVQRMGPPHWRRFPPGRAYGQLAGDDASRREIVRLGARLIAHDLNEVGINVDCLPVLDVPHAGGNDVVGDRAYGANADEVAVFGRAACEGLIAGGVLPVVKHIPGHGRAGADSHHGLPLVDASLSDLEASDFRPFQALSDMPMAMSAHVVYRAVDPAAPATASRAVIDQVIRGHIGFDGLLMTDDLSMHALSGGFADRARRVRAAGCDVVLHCNGDLAEMRAVAEGAGDLTGRSAARADAALRRLPRISEPFDAEAARARFEAAFEGRWAA